MKKIIAILLVILMLFSCCAIFASCGTDDGDDGGRCRFCGTKTNWTYKGGGYVCYSCYKKHYK